MKAIAYWIQRADFESTDHDPVGVADALRVLEQHPWHEELALRDRLEFAEQDLCEPGIGFVDGDRRILHFCPEADETSTVHYHYVERRRLLGLIPISRDRIRTGVDLGRSECRAALERFFAEDHEGLTQLTREVS